LATTVHPPLSGWGAFEKDEWELFHLDTDRAQANNVASDHPDRIEAMKGLWFYYAGQYNGLPLDDRSALEQVLAERPRGAPVRARYEFYPHMADVPESAGPPINGRSYTIVCGVEVDSADAEGVLYAHGGVAGGHSLYVKDRRLTYVFNWVGTHLQTVTADRDLPVGKHALTAEFVVDGPNSDPAMRGFLGTVTLYLDEEAVGSGKIVTQPGNFCLVGDGICVGRDSASPVTPEYADRGTFPFTGGRIEKVVVDVSGDRYVDHEAQIRAWLGVD
jgi:arylsulfatase